MSQQFRHNIAAESHWTTTGNPAIYQAAPAVAPPVVHVYDSMYPGVPVVLYSPLRNMPLWGMITLLLGFVLFASGGFLMVITHGSVYAGVIIAIGFLLFVTGGILAPYLASKRYI